MGTRHNRKRTRSRPRNRTNSNHDSHSFSSLFGSSSFSSDSSNPPSIDYWHQQYSQWQDRSRAQRQLQSQREHHEAMAAELQRIRIFGGEAGEEVSLCAPMLQVVMGLFNGRLDYEDP